MSYNLSFQYFCWCIKNQPTTKME